CIIAGGGYCTGTLLNNCNNDSIPYFLTANHCLEGGTPPDTWVFRFNWDSPTCDPTENAPTDLTVSGSTQLANNAGSDMLFLQLSSRPPAEFDVTYSGWDANGLVPDSGTCIHHPAGDIKKISHDNNPQAQANIDVGSGPADCWHVFNWESGTTEPGSSGSALWDQNHRVVGQLYGGAANCNNNVDDYFGRLDVSYPFISEWLGECGSTDLLDPGYTEPVIMYDAAITSISGVPASVCNAGTVQPTVSVKNNGAAVLEIVSISYWIIGGASNIVPWTGSLQPLQTVNVQLPPIAVTTGPQTLVVGTLQPNGQLDQVADNNNDTLDFVANTPGEPLTLTLIPDDYGGDITWTLENDNGTVLYQGGPYTDLNTTPIIREFCLGDDCYVFTINDAFGDGICCEEGNGSYTIQSAFFTQVDSDGNYGDGETREFCIDGVGVAEIADNAGARLWPNPTTGTVNVEWPEAESPFIQWSLLDLTGRLVDAGRIGTAANTATVALTDVPEGSYLVQLTSGNRRASLRLHIAR
ncbi:MAG: T9SS type A sorting domain-containing protein, partial [Flavobacteriales bacterium]|nr:T9SS type A sorting domain-containing protein [Flavobacteriales bacterium]